MFKQKQTAKQTINLGPITIGDGLPPAFFPDIDVYFKKDINSAHSLIDIIAASGTPFIKGALLHDASICFEGHNTQYYDAQKGEMVTEEYAAIIKRHVVKLSDLKNVLDYGRTKDLLPVLSVYDEEGTIFAHDIGAVAVKIPSSNIIHSALIKLNAGKAAARNIPLILDTGRSKLEEIDRAVAWVKEAGNPPLIIQHSPPGPPAAPEKFHLNMVRALGKRYNCLCGLSDHDAGTTSLFTSTALGAHVLEKGLIHDGLPVDIDIAHALPASQLKDTITQINTVHQSLGRDFRPDEEVKKPNDRMCLVANTDLQKGDILKEGNIRFCFPQIGIPAEKWDEYKGRSLAENVANGAAIMPEDVA